MTSTAELLEQAGRTARAAGLRVQTHLSEQPAEIAAVQKLFPQAIDYLDVYERAGLVHDRTILAHAVHCEGDAFRRIAAAGAAIACCPTSNAFLGSGRFPLDRASAAGATVAVGSDVGAGPLFSPLDVLRHLAYLDGRPSAAELLHRATASEGAVQVEKGQMIYSSTGKRLGQIYRVTAEGNPQVVLNSRLVTVPASTLSTAEGKISTSLTTRELLKSR